MLRSIWPGRRQSEEETDRPAPRVDDDLGVYAIGDIHGRDDLLAEMHRLIVADAKARGIQRNRIVYLGDYVDRGSSSREVIDALVADPPEGFDAIHLKGNHEDYMIRFLAGDLAVGHGWLMNGGPQTMMSYGVLAEDPVGPDDLAALRDALDTAVPTEHRAFLNGLSLYHVEGDYLFVHAGIRPDVPLEEQEEADLIWIREEFLNSKASHDKMVVHGHSIARKPQIRANRIGIDTGAFTTGVLTCLSLNGERREILQTGKRA